jgi:hypothetical protein
MRSLKQIGPIVGAGAILVMAALLVPLIPNVQAATTRVLAINNGSAHPAVPFAGFDGNPPKLFDINGDGKLEIIAQNDNQYVYVFDSKTGAILFQAKTTLPPGWGARSFNGPEVAIMQTGGVVKLIVQNSAAYVSSFRYDPANSTSTKFGFVKEWERHLNDCFANPGSDSKPTLADLDRDGRLEIVANTEEMGVYALRDDGQLYWKNCVGGGNAESSVGDLNQDGFLDVVQVSDSGWINALNGRTGGWMWSFNANSKFSLGSASMPVGPTIAQLDGLGGPDVVVGARDSHDGLNFSNDHAVLFAISSSGKYLWGKQDPVGNPLTYTHPIVLDADKDGKAEVYWSDWNTIGHKPPDNEADAWKRTGPGNFYRYSDTGALVWKTSLDTFWSNKDLALADVDADGSQEVLANGPAANGHDGIWYLDSKTGAKKSFVDLYPWQLAREPVIGDLYNDGMMEWVAEVGQYAPAAGGPGILVYNTGVPYNSMWPHLPYTSFDRPSGTTTPTTTVVTTPTTSPTGGAFAATFSPKAVGNAWWVEVQVTANQPLSKVEASVNNGTWTALTLQSWGNWAKSFYVAPGSNVTFRATSTGGTIATSAPVQWGQSTGGAFTASFAPKAVGNDWWIEVQVTANHPLSKVETSVNGGGWQPLTLQSWGNWAKSIHAPNGSQVTFRATDTAGASVTSGVTTWP